MPITPSASNVLRFLKWRPTPGTSYPIHLCRIDRIIFISNLFTIITKKRMHVYTYLEFIHIMFKMTVYILVIFKQRLELCRVTANDCEDHRQSMFSGTQHRLWCTANSDP